MASTELMQLAAALGAVSQGFAPQGSNIGQIGKQAQGMAQSAIQQEAIKKQKEEEEKKGLPGKVLRGMGTAAAVIGAPFTGGASLTLAPLAGSAAGGIADAFTGAKGAPMSMPMLTPNYYAQMMKTWMPEQGNYGAPFYQNGMDMGANPVQKPQYNMKNI